MKYVNVVIDNSSDHTDTFYTYGTELLDIKVGDKVQLPFARGNKLRDAYVFEVLSNLPEQRKGLKYVTERDSEVSLGAEAVSTCKWMRSRYLCRYIDAVKCFTPAGGPSKRARRQKMKSYEDISATEHKELTPEQKNAMDRMVPYLGKEKHKVFLINGVTSSGKTELYMQVIAEVIKAGKTAIMLVSEISLTPQTIERFVGRFGEENTAVLHSKLSLGQRYDEWMRVKQGKVKIVIGARSAVFAPLENIGALILDEEHETTYKSDMSPKYDTGEVAIKRAMTQKAVVLLGSATPSLQTAYRSRSGLFEEIRLTKRYNKTPLPDVSVVDMREELKAGNRSMFSRELFQEMSSQLEKKQQIILFLNRRGYSTFISCRSCGYVMRCTECGISMTYHKEENACICHFCGRKQSIPSLCPECGGKYIKYFGTGTEKVEEMTRELFPEAAVGRLDLDTARLKGSTDQILRSFQKGKTNILIGTQLVAKGLDFENVGLVGIISADVTLNIPDFRAPERTFQLITQAAGRAGRGDRAGKVIIQTYSPEHYAIVAAAKQDYESFYQQELALRKQISYPPFCDLFQLVFSAEQEQAAREAGVEAARFLRSYLKSQKTVSLMGPNPAPMNRINGYYRYQILMKAPAGKRREYAAAVMEMKQELFVLQKTEVLLSADVNPYSFL